MSHEPDIFVRFWGVRGSIATPGPGTVRFGGNTPCLEVRAGGRLIILDAGTGLRGLGRRLTEAGAPVDADIIFSHLHWDHIQGFPFFGPAFTAGNRLRLHARRNAHSSLKAVLAGQMTDPNFPVPLSVMASDLSFHEIDPGQTYPLGPVTLRTAPLPHPGGCIGLRIEHGGRSFVYATDTEHDAKTGAIDEALVELCRGADAVVYDAMYTETEYRAGKVGWGHSTFAEGLRVAQAAGVRTLYFFHHEPNHTDEFLDERLAEAREALAGTDGLSVEMAREGGVIAL